MGRDSYKIRRGWVTFCSLIITQKGKDFDINVFYLPNPKKRVLILDAPRTIGGKRSRHNSIHLALTKFKLNFVFI